MRSISAPWILPITQPPIADGGVVVDATDAILAIGRRADLVRLHPEAAEERADGVLLPGAGERALPPRAVGAGRRRPGRRRASSPGRRSWSALVRAIDPRAPPRPQPPPPPRCVAAGTAAVGDVGNSLAAVPGDRRRRTARDLLSRAGRLARRARRRRARRRRPRARAVPRRRAGRQRTRAAAWPHGLAYVPAPHAPYSVGPRAVPQDLPRRRARRRPDLRARRRGPRRDRAAARRHRRLARGAARMGVDPTTRAPGPAAGRLPGVAGRVRRRAAAPAGAHGARRTPRIAAARATPAPPSCSARAPTCTSPASCPTSPRCSPTASTWRSAPTAWRRRRIFRCGARLRRWPRASPRSPPATWLTPPPRGGAEAMELAPLGIADAGQAPRYHRGHAARRSPAPDRPKPRWCATRRRSSAGGRAREPHSRHGAKPSTADGNAVATFGRMVKFSHTVFALPFALAAAALAARDHRLSPSRACSPSSSPWPARARRRWDSTASSIAAIDARNPRTADARAPARRASRSRRLGADAGQHRRCSSAPPRSWARLPGAGAGRARCFSSATRSPSASRSCATCSWAWPSPAGPGGAWIAVRGDFGAAPALADDRRHHLDRRLRHPLRASPTRTSIATRACIRSPRASASARALAISARAPRHHRAALLIALAVAAHLGAPYLAGIAVVMALLVWEHAIVTPDDLSRLTSRSSTSTATSRSSFSWPR